MIERVESQVTYFLSAGSFDASDLGRCADKFDRLLRACQELPDSLQEVDLSLIIDEVSKGLDPYLKSQFGSSKHDHGPSRDYHSHDMTPADSCRPVIETCSKDSLASDVSNVEVHLDASSAKPVVADRIKWAHSPQFDPRPFLTDPVVARAFEDPETLRLPETLWIKRPVGKVHCSRKEVLKLASKWDSKGACRIFRCDECDHEEAVGIFAVAKDQDWDRLILNPVVINGRMKHYSNYTKSLAPGCLIGLVQLGPDEVLRISADDLAEMYYTFQVPDSRARRNCLRMKFHPHELKHLSCFDPRKHNAPCYVALGALAMGDSLAVEIAQQAHFQVLNQLAGSLSDHERVAYRRPFPRGKFQEFLAIDDHLGLQIVSKSMYEANARCRDTVVFERAERAYRDVGLVQHPKKKRRGVTSSTFLGAEVDGIQGRVSAPRIRIGMLMLCTALLARKGVDESTLVTAELWRHSEQRGFYTRLASPASAVLAELGFRPDDPLTREQNSLARRTAFLMCIVVLSGAFISDLTENAHATALALRGYGKFLFEQGFPRYLLVYAITGIQDLFPHFRGFMSPAWQIDRKWQLAEPGECRPVISAPILRAAVTLAALWGWHSWLPFTMIGFLGMLHPAEFLSLTRQDLVLPRDALLEQPILYVHLRNPKTARFARRQHAKIEDALVVRFLDTLFGHVPMSTPLFPGLYRRQWDRIMERLEVPHSRASKGATPAVLRGSGATHLHLATEDIQLIAWRGRWTKLKTVEFYLQEVAAQVVLQKLGKLARDRIQFFDQHSSAWNRSKARYYPETTLRDVAREDALD
eukprot:s2565_g3.t1